MLLQDINKRKTCGRRIPQQILVVSAKSSSTQYETAVLNDKVRAKGREWAEWGFIVSCVWFHSCGNQHYWPGRSTWELGRMTLDNRHMCMTTGHSGYTSKSHFTIYSHVSGDVPFAKDDWKCSRGDEDDFIGCMVLDVSPANAPALVCEATESGLASEDGIGCGGPNEDAGTRRRLRSYRPNAEAAPLPFPLTKWISRTHLRMGLQRATPRPISAHYCRYTASQSPRGLRISYRGVKPPVLLIWFLGIADSF